MAKWQQKYRVDWDATDVRNGGAQRAVWEILLEMEKFKHKAGRKRPQSGSSGLGSGKAFQRVSLVVVWAWATHFTSRERACGALCGYFEHQKSAVRRMSGGAAPDHHGHLARVEVELLASAHCFAGRV